MAVGDFTTSGTQTVTLTSVTSTATETVITVTLSEALAGQESVSLSADSVEDLAGNTGPETVATYTNPAAAPA